MALAHRRKVWHRRQEPGGPIFGCFARSQLDPIIMKRELLRRLESLQLATSAVEEHGNS